MFRLMLWFLFLPSCLSGAGMSREVLLPDPERMALGIITNTTAIYTLTQEGRMGMDELALFICLYVPVLFAASSVWRAEEHLKVP